MTHLTNNIGNFLAKAFFTPWQEADLSATTLPVSQPTNQEIARLLDQTALNIPYISILKSIYREPINVSDGNEVIASTRQLVDRFPELSSKLAQVRRDSSYLDEIFDLVGIPNPISKFINTCTPLGHAVLQLRDAGLLAVDTKTAVNSTISSPGSAIVYYACLKLTKFGVAAVDGYASTFSNN